MIATHAHPYFGILRWFCSQVDMSQSAFTISDRPMLARPNSSRSLKSMKAGQRSSAGQRRQQSRQRIMCPLTYTSENVRLSSVKGIAATNLQPAYKNHWCPREINVQSRASRDQGYAGLADRLCQSPYIKLLSDLIKQPDPKHEDFRVFKTEQMRGCT